MWYPLFRSIILEWSDLNDLHSFIYEWNSTNPEYKMADKFNAHCDVQKQHTTMINHYYFKLVSLNNEKIIPINKPLKPHVLFS